MDGFSANAASSPNKRNKRNWVGRCCQWRDWANLPEDLLLDISHKLADIEDHFRFQRVCVAWRRIFPLYIKAIGSPLLLIAPPGRPDQRDLYSPCMKNLCHLRFQLPHTKICCGSSFGWLITLEEKDREVYHVQLHNLFLNRTINLPPLDNIVQLQADEYGTFAIEYLRKAALSSDPLLSDNFILMGLTGQYRSLAFFKPGNKLWTPIGVHRRRPKEVFVDVIFFHKAKQFYALAHTGRVLAVKFQGDKGEPKLRQVAPALTHPLAFADDDVSLVEDFSTGDLLQVRKIWKYTEEDKNRKSHVLIEFLVFRFERASKPKWTRVHSLRSKVIFVGHTSSVLRAASDCPGCVPNCIYYVTDPEDDKFDPKKYYKPLSNGIYNLEDGTLQPHYATLSMQIRGLLQSTIWLEPTLTRQPS